MKNTRHPYLRGEPLVDMSIDEIYTALKDKGYSDTIAACFADMIDFNRKR